MTILKRIGYILAALAVIGIAASGVVFALQWYANVPLREVVVAGNQLANSEELVEMAAVDSFELVHAIDPELVADRVRRHPWVSEASVRRWPTGTLAISIREREPVLLVLDRAGWPQHYLDADGFAMPLVEHSAFNVPILRGLRTEPHPLRPVDHPVVRQLAVDLGNLDEARRALLSEFELRGRELWLRTTATLGGSSIEVRMGREAPGEKLERLHAFWHQAVLTQPDVRFEQVDLRFDSQVVTREKRGPSIKQN